MIKRIAGILIAAILVMGLAACSGGSSQADDSALMIPVYADPAGYELVVSGDMHGFYTISDNDDNVTHGILITIQEAESEVVRALGKKNKKNLENAMSVDFDDSLGFEFIKIGDWPGIRMEEFSDDGARETVSYLLGAGRWTVFVESRDTLPENLDQVQADMEALIQNMELREFVLGA